MLPADPNGTASSDIEGFQEVTLPSASAENEHLDIRRLFQLAVAQRASDLHLVVNAPPMLRVDGQLLRTEAPAISRDEAKRLIYGLLTDRQKAQFERDLKIRAISHGALLRSSQNSR